MSESVQIVSRENTPFGNLSLEWVLTSTNRKAVKASDFVEALGKPKSDTSRLCNTLVFADYKFVDSMGQPGRPSIYLYEHGAVQLATRIDSVQAEPLQRFIFETVVKLFRGETALVSTPQQAINLALPNTQNSNKYSLQLP